jgi:hypothetical protein
MYHANPKAFRGAAALVLMLALALAAAPSALAASPSEGASCVGQFSSFFAHGGGGTHRSNVAQGFAHDSQPAGRNVYSHVATGHGSLDDCFAQF